MLMGATMWELSRAHPVHAQLRSRCEQQVHVDGTLPAHWSRALPALCARLQAMPDADRQAKLVLRPAGRDLLLIVMLGDGRVAERWLAHPRELMTTVEAVIAVPPSLIREPPVSIHTAAPADDPTPAAAPIMPSRPIPQAQFELGAGLMTRADGRPASLSLGLQGYAALHVAWLTIALAARWDGYQTVLRQRPHQFEMSTEGGGLWALAQLLERPAVRLDAGLTFWVLDIMQTTGEGAEERGGNASDVRAGGMVRARFGRGPYRPSAGIDFELSPRRLRDDLRLDRALPTLPAWSLGLTVGVAWQAS